MTFSSFQKIEQISKRKNALGNAKAFNGSDDHIGANQDCVRKPRGNPHILPEYEGLRPFDM